MAGNHIPGTLFYPVILLLTMLATGCNKDDESDTVLLITPYDIYLFAEPREVVSLNISCSSEAGLKNLTITSKEAESYTEVILDSAITGNSFNLKYEYRVPELYENTTILLGFTLTNINGHAVESGKILEIEVNERYLEETAGYEMYSRNSGKMNAYNLYTLQPLLSDLSEDEEMHIMDDTDSHYISKKWISPAGISFVRYKDFDYANCTNISLRAAYNASIKHEFVDELEPGEVLLLKLFDNDADSSFVAVRIVNIIDTRESEFDRYIFSVKR